MPTAAQSGRVLHFRCDPAAGWGPGNARRVWGGSLVYTCTFFMVECEASYPNLYIVLITLDRSFQMASHFCERVRQEREARPKLIC